MRYKDGLVLIFESADGGGKTTLIKNLKERHEGVELVDRGFISDRVYANKFNRDSYEGVPLNLYLDYWEKWHKSNRDTRIILCNPPLETLVSRCIEKDEEFCRNRDYYQIQDYLRKDLIGFYTTTKFVCSQNNFPLLVLNTNKDLETCIHEIEEFINDAKL